ncbi:MAG: four helix bundle protein [Phycisphaerales bacterium JB039]
MAQVKSFRDLVAWQKSMDLAKHVYVLTRGMPSEERFGLTSQMRRSAVSIPSNIAEGFGRESRSDLLKFLRIARGSLNEVSTQIELASSLEMIVVTDECWATVNEVSRVLQGLIASLQE